MNLLYNVICTAFEQQSDNLQDQDFRSPCPGLGKDNTVPCISVSARNIHESLPQLVLGDSS
jgi:hypothetical protein